MDIFFEIIFYQSFPGKVDLKKLEIKTRDFSL